MQPLICLVLGVRVQMGTHTHVSVPLKVRNQANEVFAEIYSLLLPKARSALEFHAGRGGPGGWTPQPTVQVLSIPYLHPGAVPLVGLWAGVSLAAARLEGGAQEERLT